MKRTLIYIYGYSYICVYIFIVCISVYRYIRGSINHSQFMIDANALKTSSISTHCRFILFLFQLILFLLSLQLLHGLSDLLVGLDICERALDRCPGLAACHFLSDYLTLHFQKQVSPARRRHIHALHLGSKVCA